MVLRGSQNAAAELVPCILEQCKHEHVHDELKLWLSSRTLERLVLEGVLEKAGTRQDIYKVEPFLPSTKHVCSSGGSRT